MTAPNTSHMRVLAKDTMALKSVEHDKAGIEPLEMGRVQRTDNTRSGLGLELGLGLDLGLVLG